MFDFSDRLTSVINPPVDVITSCVNCLIALAARQPGKVNVYYCMMAKSVLYKAMHYRLNNLSF